MNKQSVLIADDDPMIRRLLNISLSHQNYTVYEAENGRQVIEFMEHELPGLLILDLGMPVMNGTEVCGWIRQHGINVPIMVVTVYDGLDLRIRVLDAGADDYITKPFILDELYARLRVLTRRSAVPRSSPFNFNN